MSYNGYPCNQSVCLVLTGPALATYIILADEMSPYTHLLGQCQGRDKWLPCKRCLGAP